MDISDSLSVDSEENVCIVNAYGSLVEGDKAVGNAGTEVSNLSP